MRNWALAAILFAPLMFVGCTGSTDAHSADAQATNLGGTTWQIDFGNGKTGTQFVFCRSGFWEIIPANSRSVGAKGKSWTVTGNKLETVNADDGQIEHWTMTQRDGGLLDISDGSQTLTLHPGPATPC